MIIYSAVDYIPYGDKMDKKDIFYEGTSKTIYTTDSSDMLIISHKDVIADDRSDRILDMPGLGNIVSKINTTITRYVESQGISTDIIENYDNGEYAVKKTEAIPLRVVIRNYAAGNFTRCMGISEGVRLKEQTAEIIYKNPSMGYPMINGYYAITSGIATSDEIEKIVKTTMKINDMLIPYFAQKNIDLIDISAEYGRSRGDIILKGEISPNTARMWDKNTHERLDKDRYRKSLGSILEAYTEVAKRLDIS